MFISQSLNKCDTCEEYNYCDECFNPSKEDSCDNCLSRVDETCEDTTSSSAKGPSFQSQIKELSDRYHYVNLVKEEQKVTGFRCRIGISNVEYHTEVCGVAIEAAMSASLYLYTIGRHTVNMITTQIFLTKLQEEVRMISKLTTKYQSQCPKLHGRDNDLSAVVRRMEEVFNKIPSKSAFNKHKKSSSLKQPQIEDNIKEAKKYLCELANWIDINQAVDLNNLDVSSLTGLPVVPWSNQDADGVLKVINDGLYTYDRIKDTNGNHDRDVCRLISLFGMVFCGKTKFGYPAKHKELQIEGPETIQVRARRKVMELESQVVFIYKWLVKDHLDLIKPHIPADYLKYPDLHPTLEVDTILSVIEEMKVALQACLTTNNITELSDGDDVSTLYCLESQEHVTANIEEGAGTNTYEEHNVLAEKKIMSLLNADGNRARCWKEHQVQLKDVSRLPSFPCINVCISYAMCMSGNIYYHCHL